MIPIDNTFITWNDYSKLFKVLQNGGMITFNKFCITFEKVPSGSGFMLTLNVIGKETDENVYFRLPTKVEKPKIKKEEKKIKEVKELKSITVNTMETDGFNF